MADQSVADKVQDAFNVIQRLNDGQERWHMSIPADVVRDPDLIIGAALAALNAELRRLRELVADVANSGVEFDHAGMRYVVVQVERDTWDALAEYRVERPTNGAE